MLILADIATVLSTVWLLSIWLIRRPQFLRPSIVVLSLTLVTLLWPHAILGETVELYTAYGAETYAYIAMFVLGGLPLISILNCCVPVSKLSFGNIQTVASLKDIAISRYLHSRLFILVLVVSGVYLIFVPPTQTGLYAIFFDPGNSGIARENSLKLLHSSLIRYAYLITYSVIAPLTLLLAVNLYLSGASITIKRLLVEFIVICMFLSLTGARAGLAYLALSLLLLLMVRQKLKVRWVAGIVTGAIFLYLPAFLSMFREGAVGDNSSSYYVTLILDRIFLLPTIISAWFLEYADSYGFGGWNAVSRGIGNLYNSVALAYGGRYDVIQDRNITAPTAYFIQNLYVFYWMGLIPSWIGLLLMDLPLFYIKSMVMPLKAPLYAIGMYYSLFYIQAGYGVVWITHGYLVFFAIIFTMYSLTRRSGYLIARM